MRFEVDLRAVLPLLLLSACTPEAVPRGPDDSDGAWTDTTDTPSPEVEVEIPAPTLSAEAVGMAITETLAAGIPSPLQPRTVFLSLFAHRDPSCPGGESFTLPGRFQGCTADSGWLYAGVATYEGPIEPGDLRSFSVLGDCYIVSPDDDWFIGAGNLDYTVEGGGGGGQWRGRISGRWSFPLAEGWMTRPAAEATLESSVAWDGDRWELLVTGSLSDGTRALLLTELVATRQGCGGAPSGSIGLRGEGGYWYTLDLDCGCGTVTYADGQILGETCIDIAAPIAALAEEGIP